MNIQLLAGCLGFPRLAVFSFRSRRRHVPQVAVATLPVRLPASFSPFVGIYCSCRSHPPFLVKEGVSFAVSRIPRRPSHPLTALTPPCPSTQPFQASTAMAAMAASLGRNRQSKQK